VLTRIAIAPNAFKGSLTAAEAATCIERGLRKALGGLSIVKLPMADGGDGSLLAIVAATGGQSVPCRVTDPLGRKIRSLFGLTGDGRTAVIEMALASGLALLKTPERNPMLTTSRGTGELIRAALDRRVREIVIGIGGSATNDGGLGLARALGARFCDARNQELPDRGGLHHCAGVQSRPRCGTVAFEAQRSCAAIIRGCGCRLQCKPGYVPANENSEQLGRDS
jgi:glycerate 2-kinase